MNSMRLLAFGLLIAASLAAASPGQAQPAPAKPTTTASPSAHPPVLPPGSFEDPGWAGPGGIYRVMAASAGVLAGAGAMSLFIDGWVVNTFMETGGMSLAEAAELVQDLDSQGGFEAAAILVSGLAGGLAADRLYVKGVEVLPGAYDSTKEALQPTLTNLTNSWVWVRDRVGDGSDWLQARSREVWDRTQMLGEQLVSPITSRFVGPAGSGKP